MKTKTLIAATAIMLSATGAAAQQYPVYADGYSLGHAHQTDHPLAGLWVGTGWALDQQTDMLDTALFLCHVDDAGWFSCDGYSRDREVGDCVSQQPAFHGRVTEMSDPLWLVSYGPGPLQPTWPVLTTALLEDSDTMTVTVHAGVTGHGVGGFIEHTTMMRVETFDVDRAVSVLNSYDCNQDEAEH
jgi:hypothetical protein